MRREDYLIYNEREQRFEAGKWAWRSRFFRTLAVVFGLEK